MNAQILIQCGCGWFEFSKSRTGQLDFVGNWKYENSTELENYQKISASTFWSPSFYLYINSQMNFMPKVFVAPNIDISDKDTFNFLIHIGAFLQAVAAKDSFLASSIYFRRRAIFDKFFNLTKFIMDDFCVEILFTLLYGQIHAPSEAEISLLIKATKKKLNFDTAKETLEQAFTRYFSEHTVTLSLPLVGTNFYYWENYSQTLDKLSDNMDFENLLTQSEKFKKIKNEFYSSVNVSVQAEPYNSYDQNSIVVYIENLEAKLTGNSGLTTAGHLRATAAKIIREAKPEKMSYNAELSSLSDIDTVIKFTI